MKNQINIDFQIYDSRDPNAFILLDTSEWSYIKDKPAIIEVIVPGETKPAVRYLSKNAVNVLNAAHLNLICETCDEKASDIELPDGIYDVTIKGSPDKFKRTRQYLRTTRTQLDLDNLFIQLSLECFSNDSDIKAKINKINEIQLLLKAAEANVRHGNNCVAQDLLFKAQDMISRSKKCKDCV